jgi:ABC-2 type transport system ATP-binding protein
MSDVDPSVIAIPSSAAPPGVDNPVAAVKLDGLTRRFGAHTVVDHVSLTVNDREVFGLLGRNGAGKTTLIKMLTTLLPPTSGSAVVEGFDIVRQPARVRALIGYVPQALSADGELTGYENLLVFAQLYGIARAERKRRIGETLAFMGLEAASEQLVATYSGGMIRRLEIAQSMLHRPKLLFLDEPTVGLDPVARETVWDHIRRLRRDFQTTIVMTTHYMDEASSLCSRLGILREGQLVACGSLDELRAASGEREASLDTLFARYTGASAEASEAYGDTAHERQTAKRVG